MQIKTYLAKAKAQLEKSEKKDAGYFITIWQSICCNYYWELFLKANRQY